MFKTKQFIRNGEAIFFLPSINSPVKIIYELTSQKSTVIDKKEQKCISNFSTPLTKSSFFPRLNPKTFLFFQSMFTLLSTESTDIPLLGVVEAVGIS